MISFYRVIAVLLDDVCRGRTGEDPQVGAGLVGGRLDRRRAVSAHRVKNRRAAAVLRCLEQQHVDDLSVLVDRAVAPPAGDLDVGLIHEPPVTGGVPHQPGGVGEQRGEPLHPPVDGYVVDGDAALSQQLLQIAVGRNAGTSGPRL